MSLLDIATMGKGHNMTIGQWKEYCGEEPVRNYARYQITEESVNAIDMAGLVLKKGQRQREIAERDGVSVDTVKLAYKRAKRRV